VTGVLTLEGLIAAIAAGLAFGAALPWLFARLTEPYLPEEQVALLNRAAGVLVPMVAIPLGASFLLAQAVSDSLAGGTWITAATRFVLYLVFVAAVTIADLLIQRLTAGRSPEQRLLQRVQATEDEARASRERLAQLRAIQAQVDAQTKR